MERRGDRREEAKQEAILGVAEVEASVMLQPGREAGSGGKARAWTLIVSVFKVTFLAVIERQAGRFEPAGGAG